MLHEALVRHPTVPMSIFLRAAFPSGIRTTVPSLCWYSRATLMAYTSAFTLRVTGEGLRRTLHCRLKLYSLSFRAERVILIGTLQEGRGGKEGGRRGEGEGREGRGEGKGGREEG